MSNCKVIMITSCKGGVGKTTICANLAMTLALTGKKTLMIDCDFGMRCLDLVCGLEDKVTYDITDVIVRRISYDKAIIRDERSENLYFLAAPYEYKGELTKESFGRFIESVKKALELDYILIDTHGGQGDELALAAPSSDMAIIIATHQTASIRAAEQTNVRLCELGQTESRLIINCYDQKAVKRNELPSVIDIIDSASTRLIGVIPQDPIFMMAQRNGNLVDSFQYSDIVIAFCNIAQRLKGESVPLLDGISGINRKILLK